MWELDRLHWLISPHTHNVKVAEGSSQIARVETATKSNLNPIMRQVGKQDPRIIRIATDGFTHSYYKNKYILIVTDSRLQSEREQPRYYSYSIKVANNSHASRLTRTFVNNLEFSKFSNICQIRSNDSLSSSKTEFRN
jgi:hypothetical protein